MTGCEFSMHGKKDACQTRECSRDTLSSLRLRSGQALCTKSGCLRMTNSDSIIDGGGLRKRAKRAIIRRKERDASHGSPRFLSAQRTLVRKDNRLFAA